MIAMAVTVKLLDVIYTRASAPGKTYKAETRMLAAAAGAVVAAAGLFIYGFSAGCPHFIVPLIGGSILRRYDECRSSISALRHGLL